MTGNNQPAHFNPVGLLPGRAGESKQKTLLFYVDQKKTSVNYKERKYISRIGKLQKDHCTVVSLVTTVANDDI